MKNKKTLFHGGHALYHEGLKMRSQISQYILPYLRLRYTEYLMPMGRRISWGKKIKSIKTLKKFLMSV